MRWPWNRETRAQTYTDAVVDSIVNAAAGADNPSVGRVGAVEVAAGLWARAFASASVTPDGMIADAVTPGFLAAVGRSLIVRGEAVALVEIDGGRLALRLAGECEIEGGAREADWLYTLTFPGPTAQTTYRRLGSERVIHLRYSVDDDKPWIGVSPLARASTTAALAANVETRMSEELGQGAGNLIAVPDGQKKDALQNDLRGLRGKLVLVESTAGGWGDGRATAPKRDLEQIRIGANPPAPLVQLRDDAALEVLAVCGVPVTLLERSDGTALRESWRQFMFGSVEPIARLVAAELSAKLDTTLTLSFEALRASDITGRARAFQGLVSGGMEPERAAILAGLMEPEA